MGKHLDDKQRVHNEILDRAKAECRFSDRLYNILFEYQERYHIKRKPLKESERVEDLNLELSRLYNQIWAEYMGMSYKGKPKKKQQQMEVNA